MQYPIITIITLLLWQHTYADSYYCSHNSQTINSGMTTNQVQNACGTPSNKQTFKSQGTKKIPVTQWFYAPGSIHYNASGIRDLRTPGSNNLPRMVVTFVNQKVQNVSIGGQSSPSTSMCRQPISTGDNMAKVSYACGSPANVNQTYKVVRTGQTAKNEVWTFKPDAYTPPVTLTFVNGRLQSIQQ